MARHIKVYKSTEFEQGFLKLYDNPWFELLADSYYTCSRMISECLVRTLARRSPYISMPCIIYLLTDFSIHAHTLHAGRTAVVSQCHTLLARCIINVDLNYFTIKSMLHVHVSKSFVSSGHDLF